MCEFKRLAPSGDLADNLELQINSQNTKGFHLSDGTVYTYLSGAEYEDIAAAWDWNLIPGTTLDYDGVPLSCSTTGQHGIESFVGGVSDGELGISAMRYTNPLTQTTRWQKAWFFFGGDTQHVTVSGVASTSGKDIMHVIDQKRRNGTVYVGGKAVNDSELVLSVPAPLTTLWHDGIGYVFRDRDDESNTLVVLQGNKTGAWSDIGTATQPISTVDLFAAYIHQEPLQLDKRISYTIFPARTQKRFHHDSRKHIIHTARNDASVTAVFDRHTVGIVFWARRGGEVTVQGTVIRANAAVVVLIRWDWGTVTVSDPSQVLANATITIGERRLHFALPQGGSAGKSVSLYI